MIGPPPPPAPAPFDEFRALQHLLAVAIKAEENQAAPTGAAVAEALQRGWSMSVHSRHTIISVAPMMIAG